MRIRLPVDFSIMTGVSHAALNLAALQALHPRSPQRFHSTPGCSRSLLEHNPNVSKLKLMFRAPGAVLLSYMSIIVLDIY